MAIILPHDIIQHIQSFVQKKDSECNSPTSELMTKFIKDSIRGLHAFELDTFERYIPYIVKDLFQRIDDEDVFTNQLIFYNDKHEKLLQIDKFSKIVIRNVNL